MPTEDSNDCAVHGLPAWAGSASAAPRERRGSERRRRVWWSVLYGNVNPRRRRPPRRLDDARYHSVDWHAAHLLAVATSILLLSFGDAFLTLSLVSQGAEEINPIMALVVGGNAMLFAAAKMAMTGASVTLLVFLARYRFMRRVRVEYALYAALFGYLCLIGYELGMLDKLATETIF